MNRRIRSAFEIFGIAVLVAGGGIVPGGCGSRKMPGLSSGAIEHSIEPGAVPRPTEDLLVLGQKTYMIQCAPCHGLNGDGQGPAAYLLYPRPRDFTQGQFRLVSTWDGVPTDEDLYRTISRGMPGSAMPSWAHLDEKTRWGLVHWVKSFSKQSLAVPAAYEPKDRTEVGKGVIRVPPEPPYGPADEAHARELYVRGCAPCHGLSGKGDGGQEQKDSKGFPTRPRDLTAGVFKGFPSPQEVYRRIVAGLPGSPMPMNSYLHGKDAWDLTHYVLAMSGPGQRAKVEMKQFRVVAKRVEALPTHPDAGAWAAAEPVDIHLMPLWWRPSRPEEVTVRALHDGKEIALLMVWPDSSRDHTAIRPQDFRDAAAVEFAHTPDPPFFAMGHAGGKVNIWMWKSERQADLDAAFQDLDRAYPNMGIDSYPNLLKSPIEQPTRDALTLESNPTFVTAWGAGNIVADPTRKSSVENLNAQGFGTLRAEPRDRQGVASTGVYATDSYRVLFRRGLASPGAGNVALLPGRSVPVAFAVWDGSMGDRDGKKSVTIWQVLELAP
jgi:mono/diheme cytochrome c family protein